MTSRRAPGHLSPRVSRTACGAYELGWSAAVLLAVAVGSVATVLAHGWVVLLTEAAGMTLAGVVLGACIAPAPGGPTSVRTWGLGVCATTLAFVGLAEVVGPASLPLVLTGWVTHPYAVRWVVGRVRRVEVPDGPVDGLSDDELQRRWRRTGVVVRSGWSTPAEVARLVEARARLLDEIERRDPDRVGWLLSGREGAWSSPTWGEGSGPFRR